MFCWKVDVEPGEYELCRVLCACACVCVCVKERASPSILLHLPASLSIPQNPLASLSIPQDLSASPVSPNIPQNPSASPVSPSISHHPLDLPASLSTPIIPQHLPASSGGRDLERMPCLTIPQRGMMFQGGEAHCAQVPLSLPVLPHTELKPGSP